MANEDGHLGTIQIITRMVIAGVDAETTHQTLVHHTKVVDLINVW